MSYIENCVVFCKKCFMKLKTESKAKNQCMVLHIWWVVVVFVRFQKLFDKYRFCVLKKTVNTPDPANQVFQAYLKSTWFVCWSMVCVLCDLCLASQ